MQRQNKSVTIVFFSGLFVKATHTTPPPPPEMYENHFVSAVLDPLIVTI
jgi:hypothetical protein